MCVTLFWSYDDVDNALINAHSWARRKQNTSLAWSFILILKESSSTHEYDGNCKNKWKNPENLIVYNWHWYWYTETPVRISEWLWLHIFLKIIPFGLVCSWELIYFCQERQNFKIEFSFQCEYCSFSSSHLRHYYAGGGGTPILDLTGMIVVTFRGWNCGLGNP